MNLAQQNLYMLKRLTEKKSEYSVKKLEEDYKKVQNYKKIMCNFPCINFKPRRGFSSDNKYNIEKNEMKEFFPTINYLNDGYLKKLEKKAKNNKKEENKISKNLFKNKDENNHKINKIIENKDKNDIKKLDEENEENEYEYKFGENIIDISRNESDKKDNKKKNI